MEYLNGGDLMFHIQEKGRFDLHRATWVSPMLHTYTHAHTHTHTYAHAERLVPVVVQSHAKWMSVLMEDRCCLLHSPLSLPTPLVFSIIYWRRGAVQESVSGCSLVDWPCKALAACGACVMFYVVGSVTATHHRAHPSLGIPPETKQWIRA